MRVWSRMVDVTQMLTVRTMDQAMLLYALVRLVIKTLARRRMSLALVRENRLLATVERITSIVHEIFLRCLLREQWWM